MKNVAVLTENGALALFLSPHPGVFDSSRVPTPGNLQFKAKKKNAYAQDQPEGGGGGGGAEGLGAAELTDAFKAEIPPLSEIRM